VKWAWAGDETRRGRGHFTSYKPTQHQPAAAQAVGDEAKVRQRFWSVLCNANRCYSRRSRVWSVCATTLVCVCVSASTHAQHS
jgi:hypothetical protein